MKHIRQVLINKEANASKAHITDAGLDLYANENKLLWFHKPTKIHTGVRVKLPKVSMAFITPRSSLNAKGVDVCLGTIDENYTGELIVVMKAGFYKIHKGDKIAQLVVLPRVAYDLEPVDNLPSTDRGQRGFGSTGK